MKVRCISTRLTSEQQAQLRITHGKFTEYQIIPGNTYLVLGITFMFPVEPHGGGIHYQILNDFGSYGSIPSHLFEIEDPRCSRYWIAKQHPDGDVVLWPEEFFAEFFHDDLSEGLAAPVAAFKVVVKRLKSEFAD